MSADDPVLNAAGQRIRELARVSKETADSARALLATFRGLPGGTDSARANLVLSGGDYLTSGTDEAGFSIYEGFTCEGALKTAVSHPEYAERMLGRHAGAADGEPTRLAWQPTDDPERLVIVVSAAEDTTWEVGWGQPIRQEDGTRQWRAHTTNPGGGRPRGSMGDYESSHGLLEALERRVAQDGPWWTARQARGQASS
jgi:hypothetical protein